MARKKTFAVIGLGQFGKSVLSELINLDFEVLAIDILQERVNEVANIATHALICDTTDEEALINIGIKNIDHVVVAIGANVQASILTSLILKELNVKEITVKAQNDYHERVLNKIGITDIVHPEKDMGKKIARRVSSRFIYDQLELSQKHSLIEIKPSDKITNKSLKTLNLRNKLGINIVAIKRDDDIIIPNAEMVIEENDILIVVGTNQAIDRFEKFLLA